MLPEGLAQQKRTWSSKGARPQEQAANRDIVKAVHNRLRKIHSNEIKDTFREVVQRGLPEEEISEPWPEV